MCTEQWLWTHRREENRESDCGIKQEKNPEKTKHIRAFGTKSLLKFTNYWFKKSRNLKGAQDIH